MTKVFFYPNKKYVVSGHLLNKLLLNVSNKTADQVQLADIRQVDAVKQCMYCEAKIKAGSEIILCKDCTE